jgi:hypothetical protein
MVPASAWARDAWVIDTQDEWTAAAADKTGIEITDGVMAPTGETATFTSNVKRFDKKRKATSIVLDHSPIWQNWNPTENLGPADSDYRRGAQPCVPAPAGRGVRGPRAAPRKAGGRRAE